MSFPRWLAFAILAAMPFAITAQEKSRSMDAADPHAGGATYQYESAFSGYRPMLEDDASDGEIWRAANEKMGTLGGHAGHLKGKSEGKSASPTNSELRTSSAPQAPKTIPADHSGHGTRHKH